MQPHFKITTRPLNENKRLSRSRFIKLLCSLLLLPIGGTSVAESGFSIANTSDSIMASISTQKVASHPREKTYMKRQWGVEILYVRTTAAGYMLEFRYKVLDPDKAKPLFERQTKPQLTHIESGSKFIVPTPAKTGALRNSNPPLANHTYWMFFANPGQLIKPGEHVNIQIGDFIAKQLAVQ